MASNSRPKRQAQLTIDSYFSRTGGRNGATTTVAQAYSPQPLAPFAAPPPPPTRNDSQASLFDSGIRVKKVGKEFHDGKSHENYITAESQTLAPASGLMPWCGGVKTENLFALPPFSNDASRMSLDNFMSSQESGVPSVSSTQYRPISSHCDDLGTFQNDTEVTDDQMMDCSDNQSAIARRLGSASDKPGVTDVESFFVDDGDFGEANFLSEDFGKGREVEIREFERPDES